MSGGQRPEGGQVRGATQVAPGAPAAGGIGVAAASARGRALARDLADHLGAHLHDGTARDAVRAAWHAGQDQIVLVMALGAAVRLVAPLLGDKSTDPGVVCVDVAGRHAVAVTGGHQRGANALADRIAAHLGGIPVVTTAAEVVGVPALDGLGARFGLVADAGSDLATVAGALVAGEPVLLWRQVPWPTGPLPATVTEIDGPAAGAAVPGTPLIAVTDRTAELPRPAAVLRPPSLVLGVGASRGVPADEVGGLIDGALDGAGLAPASVHVVATIDAKAGEQGILDAVARRGWRLTTLPAERLAGIDVPNPSAVVSAAVGTPSVAEAAALHLGGELVVAKSRSARATVAVARRPARGRLALVSLGPGGADHLTAAARDELACAEVVLGYGPYVDAAAPHTGRGARLERYALGEEVERARRAAGLARQGRAVALVSSGDVGIYGMASPALEQAGGDLDVVVIPGVSAGQAAAALLGAPLGHDHCAISLSDRLTPWKAILRRLEAAGEADLVVVLYNPRSSQRTWQLGAARDVLLRHRLATTPVGVVHEAARPGQRVTLTTLGDLDPATVDMVTTVVIGNTRTAVVAGRLVTPRGYR